MKRSSGSFFGLEALLSTLLVACGPSHAVHAGALGAGGSAGGETPLANCTPSDGTKSTLTAPIIDDATPTGPYRYRSVAILGGGFVTGIVWSPIARDLVFARTDVGGAYRWNGDHWMPVTDWLDRSTSNLMGIESIAFDPRDPNVVYLAAGMYTTAGNGALLRSADAGLTWARSALPTPMGGNADGRSMGERLLVDPQKPSTLYFASRTQGLWKTADSGANWAQITSFPATGMANIGLSFVLADPTSGDAERGAATLYVGVASNSESSLYRSTDFGITWLPVPGTPSGLMPHHALRSANGKLYLVFADQPGPNNVTNGAVTKYDPASGVWTDISPPAAMKRRFGGISLDASRPGTLLVTTLDDWSPDEIYRSTDDGAHWTALGAGAVRDEAGAEYLRFGNPKAEVSATGWMGDIEIDPFNSSRALYITGQGIWWSDDVDACGATHWTFRNQGLEETVPLDLAVPPAGAELLSGVGDIGGFRHDDLDRPPPAGMFNNPVFGNTSSLDFAESSPEVVVRVGSGSGKRGAISHDGGATFTAFPAEPTGSRGQGTVAIAADASVILWAPQGAVPAYSRDAGATWTATSGLPNAAKVTSDRVNARAFYAVASNGSEFFASTDGGMSFVSMAAGLPRAAVRARSVFGIAGDVWLPTAGGLYHSTEFGSGLATLPNVQMAYGVGFGKPLHDGDYPAIYVGGTIDHEDGVFRSDDGGQSFVHIDDPAHRFGYLNVIAGDPKHAGRVFLGTSGRGIIYADPAE